MRLTLRILSLLLVLSVTGTALGASQRKVPAYEKYIKQYSSLAVQHQKKYRIPASITLAQGLLESGLTAVDAYKQSTGACGGIDFWGNCWEWTTSTDVDGQYLVKGGSWDAKRDDCRSEKSDDVRSGNKGYANVGFRVVKTDTPQSK